VKGNTVFDRRYEGSTGEEMMYLGYPVMRRGAVVTVIRVGISLTPVNKALGSAYRRIGLASVFVIVLAAVVVLVVSHRLTNPLRQMTEGAERFAAGELNARLGIPPCEEMARLAEAMNNMASELQARIKSEEQQRKEQTAVLSSMQEGVIAVDNDERILQTNSAARFVLGVADGDIAGRSIQETIRIPELQSFAGDALSSESPIEREVSLANDGGKILQARGTPMLDLEGNRLGALLVLNDVTRIKRLEKLRKDFVANVSHELKTPVTSIKGFVETLLDGPLDEKEQQHFLRIIEKQVNRLDFLIRDILSLSRIEHENGESAVELQKQRLAGVIKESVEICSERATRKGASINLNVPKDLEAMINAPLLEQALVNLIDNAVKFGDVGVEIQVEAAKEEDRVVVSVSDNGPGIEKRHLDRLFERFYRVDKGRSRQLGGTGLGLAIVKHVALAHRGDVSVDSRPGQGTVFRVFLQAGL
jgi:two-component system phosphate regulon sensor histidine kinase PhoR